MYLAARRHEYWAGILIGLAACVKVAPALLLVYLLYRRQWRPALSAAIAAAALLLVWPALWIGWAANWRSLLDWVGYVPLAFAHGGDLWSLHINQSLTAILNRLFGTAVAIDRDVWITLFVLPAWALQVIRIAISIGVLAGLAAICRVRVDATQQPLAYATEVGLVQIAMLLLSGFTWKAHFVALLLPYTVLLAYLADARHAAPRRTIGILLIISFALDSLTGDPLGPRGADYAEAYGLIALGALACGVALAILRHNLIGEETLLKSSGTRRKTAEGSGARARS